MFYLDSHSNGYLLSGVFFGISSLLLGVLIFKSSSIPKLFGVLIATAGISYQLDSFAHFLFPEVSSITNIM